MSQSISARFKAYCSQVKSQACGQTVAIVQFGFYCLSSLVVYMFFCHFYHLLWCNICFSSHLGPICAFCSQPSNVHHDFRHQLSSCDGLWIYRDPGVACILFKCVTGTKRWRGSVLLTAHLSAWKPVRRFVIHPCRHTCVFSTSATVHQTKCCLVQNMSPERKNKSFKCL